MDNHHVRVKAFSFPNHLTVKYKRWSNFHQPLKLRLYDALEFLLFLLLLFIIPRTIEGKSFLHSVHASLFNISFVSIFSTNSAKHGLSTTWSCRSSRHINISSRVVSEILAWFITVWHHSITKYPFSCLSSPAIIIFTVCLPFSSSRLHR